MKTLLFAVLISLSVIACENGEVGDKEAALILNDRELNEQETMLLMYHLQQQEQQRLEEQKKQQEAIMKKRKDDPNYMSLN